AGVLLLLAERVHAPADFSGNTGALLVLGSALSWAAGSFMVRHRRQKIAHLTGAAYQMFVGGGSLLVIGLCLGEGRQLAAEQFTPTAVYSFFHLLIVGSLVGFVAYNWLLGHVSSTMAGVALVRGGTERAGAAPESSRQRPASDQGPLASNGTALVLSSRARDATDLLIVPVSNGSQK